MTYQAINPLITFCDSFTGRPLTNGKLYIGRMDTDPKGNPSMRLNVYAVQPDGSETLLAQPIQLNIAGQPSYEGDPIQLKIQLYGTEQAYSLQKDNWFNADRGYVSRAYSFVDLQTFEPALESSSPFGVPMADVVSGSQAAGLSAPALINVPADYPTIGAAFASIQNKRIPVGATCTIKVADGTHEVSSALVLNHPDGLRLRLVGNETNELLCTLTIPLAAVPSFDMIIVSNGNALGYVNGFNIVLPVKATNWTGILAVNGAFINCGNKIRVNNFYYGIAARIGSEVICDYAKVDNAGDVGIWAYVGSAVSCNYAVSNNATDATNNLGFGIQAEFGSAIECTGASASGCRIGGIASLSNSLVRAHNAIASTNTGSGFYASADGHIENHNAVASGNTRYGEERVLGGTMAGGGVSLSGNTLGNFSGYAYFDNSGALGARIAANGDLRIDVNGANEVYFNSAGGVQSQITHTASSSSWTLQRASSANQPGIEPAGAAASIDYNVRAKGSGRVFAASNRVNFVSFAGADSGGIPVIAAEGGGTNIDLLLKGKGTGVLRWGVHSGGTATPNGYIQFKLEDGATVRVPAERI